jgi:uncharacterized protein (DUF1499 family)
LRYYQHQSRKALWSQRIALMFLLLFAITFGAHRFGLIQTPVAMKLFGTAIVGALIALGLGLASLVVIWREGHTGAGRAVSGAAIGLAMLAVPLWSLPDLLALPRLHEVTTDLDRPPAFQRLAAVRTDGANPAEFQRGEAPLQLKAYPDIKPLPVSRPTADAFSAVKEAVKNLEWQVIAEQPPTGANAGTIEAVDRSLIFGFTDDVIIRVSGVGKESRVDVRSSARHGVHDLGRNAERVRQLFTEVRTQLTQIEKNEAMTRAVALREQRVQKAMNAKERRRKQQQSKTTDYAAKPLPAQQTGAPQLSSGPSAEGQPRVVRAPSQAEAQAAPAQSRPQRRAERTRSLRRFWEQLAE